MIGRVERQQKGASMKMMVMGLIVGFGMVGQSYGSEAIDLSAIAYIESSNNPLAVREFGRDRSYGLYQISPIALKDWNQLHPSQRYGIKELLNPEVNATIARWLFAERLPNLLRAYGRPVDAPHLILAYNCGISCAKAERWPATSKAYLAKYQRIVATKAKSGQKTAI